jgi:hypothetical protein
VLSLVEHILKSVTNENLTDLLIVFHDHDKYDKLHTYCVQDGDEEVLVDIVLTLNNYLYSKEEIAAIVLEFMKMLIFKSVNKFNDMLADIALINGYVDGWLSKYYDCRLTKLRIYDENGFTRFWLPECYEFLDEGYRKEFSSFDKICYEPYKMLQSYFNELADNAKIFIYQHKPQKIMPYENMKKMFIDLVLPQHFAFRYKSDRIYTPDYVTKICLCVFGNNLILDKDISKSTDNAASIIVV